MKIQFDHDNLHVYQETLGFISWADRQRQQMSTTISATDHLDRASESTLRNIARANGKESPRDRRQTFDIAYASALECAASLDVLHVWDILELGTASEGKAQLDRIVAMLIGIRSSKVDRVREPRTEYAVRREGRTGYFFAHEQLDVYQSGLRYVAWTAKLTRTQSLEVSAVKDLDRRSTSIVLNIAEGNGKFSAKDRCRFLSIARGAALDSAATLDILMTKTKITPRQADQGKTHLCQIVSMLVGLARSLE